MEHVLIGKTISKLQIADDKKAILFELENNESIVARADGDCCSSTWIEHIELPAMGFPAKVLSVTDLEMPDYGSQNKYEVIAYYGFKITTDRGDIVIDYRNESNGYYGGNLCFPGDYFYGGVDNQNVSSENWVEITDDI